MEDRAQVPPPQPRTRRLATVLLIVAVFALVTFALVAFLVTIFERKAEALNPYVRVVEVTDQTTDPAEWGKNWPKQYDQYKRTAELTRTRFGGHGGSDAMPEEKLERDPWLRRMFAGYAFSIDYRDRRGHAYMLYDQENTERVLKRPQVGSCLHCHASVMPMYAQLGNGDVLKGFEASCKLPYKDANLSLQQAGSVDGSGKKTEGAHPVSCVDCHDPKSMQIRVTRPGFIQGIQAFAGSEAPAPHLPSVENWRKGDRRAPYDPNVDASRQEMRSFVCAQCHVEYYCGPKTALFFPWGKGLKVEQIEAYYDDYKFSDGHRFFDWKHAETGAELLKAQHPEFELWSQGIHARSGVSCADCHMPYMRDGATKISDHWVRSPLLNINRACQTCHRFPEQEIRARVDLIQQRNFELLERAAAALVAMLDAINAAKSAGATDAQLAPVFELQRKAQWRLDFVAAENSMGFHAPQEAGRILAEAIDYARQAQLAALQLQPRAVKTADAGPAG